MGTRTGFTPTWRYCARLWHGRQSPVTARLPRDSHVGWKPPKHRRDPVAVVLDSNANRIPQLVPLRMGRMAASPFAFYRGAAALMAAQHARLSESDAGRLAIAAARAYRETMADYSSMRVLDVWYDRILESNFTEKAESADVKRKVRRQLDENIGEGRRKSVPDHLFPKLRTTGRS